MKIGVIGAAGKIGRMRVATILNNDSTELVAVHDLEVEKAREIAGGAAIFENIEDFFAEPMDAVVISVPAHAREPLCLKAFESRLHVLAEKPLVVDVEAAHRILEAAKSAGRVLAAGFDMRFYPSFKFVKDSVQSGMIGEIDHVRVYGAHEGLTKFDYAWEYKSQLSGGGALWDVGIHMTDMMRHVMGEITQVYGVATERVWQVPGSEDNAMAIFQSSDGVPAIYQATWNDWTGYHSRIEVYGTKGMVRGTYGPMQSLLVTMDKPGANRKIEKRRYLQTLIREKLQSWKVTAMAAFAEELSEFVRFADGERGLRIADGHAALRAIEIARAVRESSEIGQPIELPVLGDMQ